MDREQICNQLSLGEEFSTNNQPQEYPTQYRRMDTEEICASFLHSLHLVLLTSLKS